MNFVVAILYNLILFAGTAYLVQAHNWSPWWFVLAFTIGVYLEKK